MHTAMLALAAAVLAAPATAAEITGTIRAAGGADRFVEAGYYGRSTAGQELSNMAGLTAGETSGRVSCTTYRPRNTSVSWEPATGGTFQHVGLPAGTYVLYVRVKQGRGDARRTVLMDWRVVTVASPNARLRVDLAASPSRCGNLRITAPRRSGLLGVRVTPSDAQGREPVRGAEGSFGLTEEADLGRNGAELAGLREGWYRVKLQALHRTGTPQTGQMTTYDDLGAWTVRVLAGKRVDCRLP